MPDTRDFRPDLAMAQRFLAILDETAESFVFQTFDDLKSRKDRGLAAKFFGHLDGCAVSLLRLQRRGAGVFVTVNETDGKGRKLENITRIRAIWHEEDTPCGKAFPLEPHMVIESSPGKFHRYWLVDGLEKGQFPGVMERMIRDYGSDPNVKDIARVLRLPGFFHQKDPARPFQVRLIHESGAQPYSAEEILSAFPPLEPESKAHPSTAEEGSNPAAHKAAVTELASRAAKRTHEDPKLGRHSMVLWLGRECAHRGIPADWAGYAVKVFGSLMRQTDTTGKAAPLNVEAEVKSFCDAHAAGLADPPEKRPQMTRGRDGPVPSSRESSNVVDFNSENEARLAYEKKIEETDEFGQLAYVLAPEIDASGLRQATKTKLLKKIAEKADISVKALLADLPSSARRSKKPSSPEDYLRELNEKHAVVPVAGRVLILNREYDPSLGRPLVTFSAPTDFKMRYLNRRVLRNGEEIDIGTVWLESPERAQFEGLVFLPGGEAPGYFNLWTGWGVDPKPGECVLFRRFIFEVIAGRDKKLFFYIWCWLAHLFQRPQELPGTALVLRGKPGIGKNTLVETIGRLVGTHFVTLSSLQQVAGRFQGHLADALLVFANEAIWGGDKSAEGTLKAMITDPHSAIERKGKDIVMTANFKRLIVASNEDWVVPRGRNDRRFVIVDVTDERRGDREYFGAIKRELESGGYEALMHELMTLDLGDFQPSLIPEQFKHVGWELAIRSAGSVERWWFDVLQRGFLSKDPDSFSKDAGYLWPESVPTHQVQSNYLGWCQAHRIAHPETVETLGRTLRDFGLARKQKRDGGERVPAYYFPSLDAARSNFGSAYSIPLDWWDADDEETVTGVTGDDQ
jgi:hypothetical protein